MFSDLQCSACTYYLPKALEIIKIYKNDINLVYRHFPLASRKIAKPAAVFAELAGEKNKFWNFIEKSIESKPNNMGGFQEIALECEVDLTELSERARNVNDKCYKRVEKDLALAKDLLLKGTPAFILVNHQTKSKEVVGLEQLEELLKENKTN